MAITARQLGHCPSRVPGTACAVFEETEGLKQSANRRCQLHLDRTTLETYQDEAHHPG